MDDQQRLSKAYSNLKDKHVTLQRIRDGLQKEVYGLKRENQRLWTKLKMLHERAADNAVLESPQTMNGAERF